MPCAAWNENLSAGIWAASSINPERTSRQVVMMFSMDIAVLSSREGWILLLRFPRKRRQQHCDRINRIATHGGRIRIVVQHHRENQAFATRSRHISAERS